uniref:Protein ECT2 n=1 Tax=Anopheles albimanus TaxID=7167 RepID=A0A182FD87_ANOAL
MLPDSLVSGENEAIEWKKNQRIAAEKRLTTSCKYCCEQRRQKGILGPPALQQAVTSKEGLVAKNRPVYNYCMRGVISCFTGIRKKDELSLAVNLIHSMGGSIRKDMNTKVTHLVCNNSGGEKYRYATTFRLAIIHPSWVTEAWERRHDPEFSATTKEFTDRHRVKAFDGYKVCFFGFQEDEKQHMIDVLQSNGGCPTELEDPDCTHVVMPNTGAHFIDVRSPTKSDSSSTSSSSPKTPPREGDVVEGLLRNNAEPEHQHEQHRQQSLNTDGMENEQQQNGEDVENDRNNAILPVLPEENESQDGVGHNRIVGSRADPRPPRHGGEHLMSIAENDNNHNQCAERSFTRPTRLVVAAPTMQYIDEEETDPQEASDGDSGRVAEVPRQDGVVLTSGEANQFLDPNNLSPILKSGAAVGRAVGSSVDESFCRYNDDQQQQQRNREGVSVNNGQQEEDDDGHDDEEDMDDYVIASREAYKRKRPEDSFDDQSMLSVDISIASTVMYGGGACTGGSAKKPKLTRTGSISRGIRRSMSFVTMTPIKSMFRSRRNSVDPNASTTSINSVDTTFNESIKKPVKEKLRTIRDKITKGGRKDTPKTIKSRSGLITSTNLDNLKKVCNFKTTVPEKGPQTPEKSKQERTEVDFKTPVAPPMFGGSSSSATKMVTRSRGKLSNAAASFNLHQRHSIATTPGSLATVAATTAVDEEMETDECNTIAANSTMLIDDGPMIGAVTAGDAEMIPVVDEHVVQTKPETKNKNTHIVKADWFWYTIQAGYANEVDYLFADYLESIAHTPAVDRRDSLPVSFNKRKRKRLSQRTPAEGGTPISIGKRRSSVSDAGLLSVSGSFLDCTTSPDKHEASKKNVISEVAEASMEQPSAKTQSMRHNHFMDFFHTESNYVGILDTIVKLFKEPLEEMVENENALLNKSELRSIFGNFLPIHDVHKRMLARLQAIHGHWTEEVLIGQIVLDHRDDLLKAYPPYVNFFEQMKETLVQCDASNPRFHAFLKINQAKPECGRQSLQDLMIRPVQRLPSISLLLNDILKHTPKGNPDSRKLDESLKAIKEVMTYINEDKRKTEGQMALFDIFNDIDNCPPHLVSSHRNFVSRCEVTELSDSLSGRGDPLVLFLFNDTLEVCKKRSRVFHNAKSPNTNTLNLARSSCATTKPYKHLKLMPLSTVRLVVNIEDSPRAFMLNCRELAPNAKDRQYSFNMADEEQDKLVYLRTLSKQMAENACRTDAAHFLINRTAEEVDIDVSDINVGTLSKAFKFASKTRIRVGRAFSFNKTPSKLKRAVSTMMTSPFGSTQSLTPASQMAQMKLASCTNLNEVGEETGESKDGSPSSSTNVLVAPMSVQPTRKNKNPPPSIATLRHL